METRKNDSLVEFELQNSEMGNISGGAPRGFCGGHYFAEQNVYCSGDFGNPETQEVYIWTGCEKL